jgi:beta-lactamase regulating signal transducer with metallopeptidase domain
MIAYILKSSVSLLMMFAVYWFLLRKEKLFVFNRFFLISAVIFSLIVPFITIPVHFTAAPQLKEIITANNYPSTFLKEVSNDASEPTSILSPSVVNRSADNDLNHSSFISLSLVLFVIYILGAILFLFRFSKNLFYIKIRINQFESINYRGCRVHLTDDKTAPSCFFRNIFLNREDYQSGLIDQKIIDHEVEHAIQLHAIDIILIEAVKIAYWFNPIYILYDRAIRINHEYLADNGIIAKEFDVEIYIDKLIRFVSTQKSIPLTSSSHFSFTKNRIAMMQKIKSGIGINAAKIIAAISLGTLMFLLLSFKESQPAVTSKTNEKIATNFQKYASQWQVKINFSLPELDPEAIQIAWLNFDPSVNFNLKFDTAYLGKQLRLAKDEKEIRMRINSYCEVMWNLLFKEVKGSEVYLLSKQGSMISMVSDNIEPKTKKWLVSKVFYLENKPYAYAIPLELENGSKLVVSLNKSNLVSLDDLRKNKK